METVTASEFNEKVLKSSKPVLVDFWAEWCAPCKMLKRTLESVEEEHGDAVSIVTVDVDAEIELAGEFAILSIPTMILFVDGREALRMTGAKNKPALLYELGQVLKL